MSGLYSVAAIGDVSSPSTFSGTPYHFCVTAQQMGLSFTPWQMNLALVMNNRRYWNLMQLLQLQRPGGYQYSPSFSQQVLKQIPEELFRTTVISFNQHFPPADYIIKKGGRINYYIDATFSQLLDRYGVGNQIGRKIKEETLQREKDFFQQADHIFTMQQWAKDSVVSDYGVPESKVKVILPGANILFDKQYEARPAMQPDLGKTRPLVLGFVGKDWQRKGLPVLAKVRALLEARGWNVIVRCAGMAPPEFKQTKGIEFVGFIDKHNGYDSFIQFLASCDIGCLFSEAEFSSISVLEFISVGRPVAGFVVDGMGDLFIPELSMRFDPTDSIEKMADGFERYLADATYRNSLNHSAIQYSQHVRWERSVNEITTYL